MDIKELAELGFKKLQIRFEKKIYPEDYYLSYSGGRDSHLLFWFIKHERLPIKVIAVNTYREHKEIVKRMYENSDKVLYPVKKFDEIKDVYGIPCFTKSQDEIIRRYQNGSRAPYTLSRVYGTGTTIFKLNNKARNLLVSGKLHKVSQECCKYTKKEPLKNYHKETGLLPILGVRGSESKTRKNAYPTCLTGSGTFTPLFDFSDDIVNAMYEYYNIDDLKVYEILDRTGCIGCPYGNHGKKMTSTELKIVSPAQRKYAIDSFKESYDVLGILY